MLISFYFIISLWTPCHLHLSPIWYVYQISAFPLEHACHVQESAASSPGSRQSGSLRVDVTPTANPQRCCHWLHLCAPTSQGYVLSTDCLSSLFFPDVGFLQAFWQIVWRFCWLFWVLISAPTSFQKGSAGPRSSRSGSQGPTTTPSDVSRRTRSQQLGSRLRLWCFLFGM